LDFSLLVDSVTIRGELIAPAVPPPYPAVIICHGIPAEAKHPQDRGYAEFAERVATDGLGAVIFNFRGCGLSGGNFEITGWQADLCAVIEFARKQPEIDASRLGLLGFSGGAAVAVSVAAVEPGVRALAACACPADLESIARAEDLEGMIRYFRGVGIIRDADFPAEPLAWQRAFAAVRPEDCMARLAPRPVLIAHGDADDTVPLEHAYRLYAAAAEPKTLEVIPGTGHRLRHNAAAMRRVIHWLRDVLR